MKTVATLLKIKGHDVWSIAPGATVYEALEKMSEKTSFVPSWLHRPTRPKF